LNKKIRANGAKTKGLMAVKICIKYHNVCNTKTLSKKGFLGVLKEDFIADFFGLIVDKKAIFEVKKSIKVEFVGYCYICYLILRRVPVK